jgi:hypothetical protein
VIVSVSVSASVRDRELVWRFERRRWGLADLLALLVWTAAIVVFFWKAVSLQEALFYFDITEINYPYRDFFARELRAGRFSRWHPGLYCGLPLFSESQAGYLHPLKYLLYPWLATWQAFNLDTVVSVWLTGIGAYGWLRRHVGAAGALTGAAVFGLSGFVWAHFIHTSMINALTSVPFVFWAIEAAWETRRLWPVVLGAIALACQVFSGHLQDTILTAAAAGLYTLHRAATERGVAARLTALALPAGVVALALLIAAVQWVPSKELLDRSPRARGLTWKSLTYGSWHPELLPTLVVREAYGTRARDTDWMDGFYPYHEMNAYLGLIAMALAILGGAAYRDRWVSFWVILAGVGGLMMLGRFTFLFDQAHRVPIAGSSRIPVRFHLWVALATAALSAVGVDRLARPGKVRLRGALAAMGVLILVSIPILVYVYTPVWTESQRWPLPNHLDRFRWLGQELTAAAVRTAVLAAVAVGLSVWAVHTSSVRLRPRLAALLPVLVIADLLGAHSVDVPTITPAYWTDPPDTARVLKKDPGCLRIFGIAERSSGEPGYASEPVDFLAYRDTLAWSLPPIWGLLSAAGETPIIPERFLAYTDNVLVRRGRFDIEGVSHLLTGRATAGAFGPGRPVGSAHIYHNPGAQPRVRLIGRPRYAADEAGAIAAVKQLGAESVHTVVVEDPDRPLPEDGDSDSDAEVAGRAAIASEVPERVEVVTECPRDAYLVLADTFDPGWSATLDGRPVPIRPAWITFRAVFVPRGKHTLVFRYRPAGFDRGLMITACGLAIALGCLVWPRRLRPLAAEHEALPWPRHWPHCFGAALIVIVLASTVSLGPSGLSVQQRWYQSVHRFTWGAGIEAMRLKAGP